MTDKDRDSDAPEERERPDEVEGAESEPEQEELETESEGELADETDETDERVKEPIGDEDLEEFSGDQDDIDPLADAEDAIDPELLALVDERPSPKLHRPIVMGVVCVLIGVMMVWFWSDVKYFFAETQALDLGEAHDIRFSDALENRFVAIEGIPLAPRNENPAQHCGGSQGFPTYQRRFLCRGHQSAIPVMGRPAHDLIIQRFMVRQLRVEFDGPEGQDEETLQAVTDAVNRVAAVHDVRPTEEGEIGRLIADVEGTSGRTDVSAVANSVRFQIEASVPGVKRVRVERVRREVPGSYQGRLVRLRSLGSRFAAVADYLNECTSYPVSEETWVLLDGSEAGQGSLDGLGICYGHAPRQYWPYLVLYIILASIFVLNIILLVRFYRSAYSKKD